MAQTKQIKNEISEEKLDKYESVTKKALDKAKIKLADRSHLHTIAKDFYSMALDYFNDAKHFRKSNDYVNAFAALNYAHGWLDAGARLGLFDVEHDSTLFTVD